MQFCYRCTDRSGADTRVKLLKPLQNSPKGFTGLKAHRLASLDGMGLFLECTDNSYVRRLDLPHDVGHSVLCMCFVQLLQLVCLKLIASFGMVGMLLTVAMFVKLFVQPYAIAKTL